MSDSIAMLSVHTSPLDTPGKTRDAGGMNIYMRQLAAQLGQRQVKVDIFTRWTDEHTPRIVPLSKNVRVISIKAGPVSPVHKNDLYQYLPTFIQRIDDFRRNEGTSYSVLHSHYWLSGVAGMHLAHRWEIPHVTMFHTLGRLKKLANPNEPEPDLRLEMEQKLIKQVDTIIATTQDERTQMIRQCGASPQQVRVIPCGVDTKLFHPLDQQQTRQKLGLKTHQPIILFVGRLDPFKGPDLLLRATSLMEREAQIVIVGGKLQSDPDLQKLQRLAHELGISSRVHFPGAQQQQELPTFYSAADVTVVPSFHESFGLVAVESLACGTPVVATRAGGLMTVVRDGETGYLVARRCPGFFAERLDTLLKDQEVYTQMRLAARPSVLQYSWSHIAGQVHDLYDELTRQKFCLAAR